MHHSPVVRDKLAFLRRMMTEFAGGRMSLDGDLSRCRFAPELVVADGDRGESREDGLFRRNSASARQDFVTLRLDPDALDAIFEQIRSAGVSTAIIHVEIERDGVLQLGAYDNFHPECVSTGPGVSTELLDELMAEGIIAGYLSAVTRTKPHGTATPIFAPGFRMSAFDGAVIAIGALAAAALVPVGLGWSLVVALPVLHFFLFCNVFRISRRLELVWAGAFVLLAGSTLVWGLPGWWLTVTVSVCVTAAVVAVEMRKSSYHGIGWQWINPDLRKWWDLHELNTPAGVPGGAKAMTDTATTGTGQRNRGH